MPINLSDILKNRPEVTPTIYGYILPDVKTHDGYIKIGYTDRGVETRLKEQLHTSAVNFKVLFKESAVRPDGTCFTDHDVHALLDKRGFKRLNGSADNNEWYKISKNDALAAIHEIQTGIKGASRRTAKFEMREEQQRAVNMAVSYFKRMRQEEPDTPPKMLWNAKMRFGKTFTSYCLAKEMGMKRILILTFKPAVESAWQEDLDSHVYFEGWQFVSNKEAKYDAQKIDEQFEQCDPSRPIVVFGSFQDILGTNDAGGIKAKNEFIHTTAWDIVIFDEYHFGAWRDNAKKLFQTADEDADDFDYEEYSKNEAGNAINETWLPITTSYYLFLSGTPFRALNSGEFLEDQIFNWTYSDEQYKKEHWDYRRGDNPYASLPRMVMLTYKVPDSITEVAMNEGYDEFDINEFLKASYQGKDPSSARFIYEEYVQKWVKLIQGDYMPVDGLKMGSDRPPMPFSDTTLLNVLSHTLWFLPNVASCYAMKNLLRQKQNTFFDDYNIVVCAGKEVGVGIEALKPVQDAMKDPLHSKSIILSCGKLTTGVTIKPLTGIFMLRNLKSPETYFQAAFRVQSPWEVTNENGEREIIKKDCYIFDFALERALKQISDYSVRLKVSDSSPEKKVADFIHFMPVLAFDGAAMNSISAQDVLDITYAGTSATLLAKRWQTALLVHVDNETLKKLRDNEEALNALMNIEGFRSLNKDIETIINKTDKLKKEKGNTNKKPTQKEKEEMSEDEKQTKAIRKQVQENLLKLAARIPAFMYLIDYREQCIKDVITQIEPELFEKVTGLQVKDFDTLCSIGLFDPEKMNQGIFGFRRYENASLSYAGIDKHANEDVGGWDTVLKREEYHMLYSKQQATLSDIENTILSASGIDIGDEPIVVPTKPETKPALETISPPPKPEGLTYKSSSNFAASSYIKAEKQQEELEEWEKKLEGLNLGSLVFHKTFGQGQVVWFDAHKKYVKVKFKKGEKQFPFPQCFISGFLVKH